MSKTKTELTKADLTFRKPGSVDWFTVSSESECNDSKKEALKSNKDELNNILRASLQMQNLVVLAGSGCSLAAGGPSMSDLWVAAVGEKPQHETIDVAQNVNHDITYKNIEAFLSRAEAFLQIKDDDDVATFLNRSKKVILDKCSGFAEAERLDSHIAFLHRLSRRRVRDQRLKVFTTNYDLCFELAASEMGGVPLDGFSFTTPRHYDPRYFSYDIIKRPRSGDDMGNYLEGVFLLYKLHGSVNWARGEESREIFEKKQPDPSEACLIYPASGKYQQSFTQPHLESMAQYLTALREPNTCAVVVGFGFNDNHLAEPLLAAAKSNPHLRLVIVGPSAKQKTVDGNTYWAQLSKHGRDGEDVWFINASFDEFARTIPDLKSLTPADGLLKALRGATRDR